MTEGAKRGLHPRTSDLYLHAAILEAAKLSDTTPEDWVQTRMRACLSVDLAGELGGQPKAALAGVHRWVAGYAPFDSATLPSAEEICTRLAATPEGAGRRRTPKPPTSSHRLYDPDALEAAAARVSDQDHQKQFHLLARRGPGRSRPLVSAAQEGSVRRLLESAPHLAEATEAILAAVAIARRAKSSLRLAPLLLAGPPASGKTWWARQMADALGVPLSVIVMPKVTASFVLSGSTSSWSAARPGRIVQTFESSDVACPLIVLDEVEKASTGNYDPAPVLLDLLDGSSARRWHDEYYGIDFDVSSAIILATCNDPEMLDPALRSRFREIQVAAPGPDALPGIIQSAWTAHRRLYPTLRLPAELPQAALNHLAKQKPDIRELQRRFDDAIARAVQRPGRIRIIPADLGAPAVELARRTVP